MPFLSWWPKMIDELDCGKDHIGLIRPKDFVCGACRNIMLPAGAGKYHCPKCGMVFNDNPCLNAAA